MQEATKVAFKEKIQLETGCRQNDFRQVNAANRILSRPAKRQGHHLMGSHQCSLDLCNRPIRHGQAYLRLSDCGWGPSPWKWWCTCPWPSAWQIDELSIMASSDLTPHMRTLFSCQFSANAAHQSWMQAAKQCLQGRLSGSDHGDVLCGEGVHAEQAPHLRPCRSQDRRWKSSQRASQSPTRLAQQGGLTSTLDACACGETHACTNAHYCLATSSRY